MDEKLYREVLLDRFANKVNYGVIPKPDLQARLVNPLCGDEVLLQIKVKKGVIEQAKYSGNGCAISQVAASFLAERIEKKTLSEIQKISGDDILNWLGVEVGQSRLKCALLPFEVLKEAIK